MFATAVGFGALAISDIRPVRDMGLWTAGGLIVSWIGCFTLFPALQSLLRTPMRCEKASVAKRFLSFADALVPASDRYRWPLVGGALVLMLCGAAVLFGIPRVIAPLALETDALTYVNPGERVAQDTRYFEESNALDTVELWLQTPPGHALDPEFLRALEQLTRQLESDSRITAVDGPTSVLRWARYVETRSDQLPTSASAWPKLASDLEQIMLTEPGARAYTDVTELANVRLTIRGRAKLFGPIGAMRTFVERNWAAARAAETALRSVRGRVAGQGVLATEITQRLLPTLAESFVLTGSVIFSRIPAGVSQSLGHVDNDDSVAVRDPVRVSSDALDEHSAQYCNDPHRLDHTGCDPERPDSFLLPFSRRPLDWHDQRRSTTCIPDSWPPDRIRDFH